MGEKKFSGKSEIANAFNDFFFCQYQECSTIKNFNNFDELELNDVEITLDEVYSVAQMELDRMVFLGFYCDRFQTNLAFIFLNWQNTFSVHQFFLQSGKQLSLDKCTKRNVKR